MLSLSSATLEMPWEMKLTISMRAICCCLRKNTAWLSCSLKIAASTLAPLTSPLPELCTWNTARCSTRWKPRVGWVSRSLSWTGIRGVVESINSDNSRRRRSISAPQARSTAMAAWLSSKASSRCSTVMNSWRLLRASLNARFRVISRSLLSIVPPHHATSVALLRFPFYLTHQRVLTFPGVFIYLGCLGFGNVPRVDSADRPAFSMDPEHDLCSCFPVQHEKGFQHLHHEIHRSVIIIEHDHLIARRRLQLGLSRFYR